MNPNFVHIVDTVPWADDLFLQPTYVKRNRALEKALYTESELLQLTHRQWQTFRNFMT